MLRDRPRAAPRALRRAYPLPVEMLILAAVIGVWELARIPFEGSTSVSLAHAREWISLERTLHIDIEPTVLRFVHSRDWLLDGALRFYRNMDLTAIFGFMAVARLLDPVRYPKLRSALRAHARPGARRAGALPARAAALGARHSVRGRPTGASERPPQRDSGGRQPALRRPRVHRGRRLVAATTRLARLADPALPAARLRRHPGHRQSLRARHARRQRLRGSGSGRRPPTPRAPPARRPGRSSVAHRACGNRLRACSRS